MSVEYKFEPELESSYIVEKIESKAIYVDFENDTMEFITMKPLKVSRLIQILESYPNAKQTYNKEKEKLENAK